MAAVYCVDKGGPDDTASIPSLIAALAQLSEKALQPMWRYTSYPA
jgi:hypothetical protein